MKLRYGKLETTIKKGLEQTADYMDKCGTREGYLLVFDREPEKLWKEKIFKKNRHYNGKDIPTYGM
ncbi:MAG: hypothetical protein GY757_11735 [bacterium]|nr:hypothetical protein [bacterium]